MLNKVTLIGNLGQDPDVRTSPNGTKIVRISLATTRRWKDRASGEGKTATEWHRVVFFNRTAEVVEQYLRKGSQVYIEGRIQTQKYQGKDGQDRYSTDIIAEQMQMDQQEIEQTFAALIEEHDWILSIQPHTHIINKNFDYSKKITLLQQCWQIAYADNILDKHEEHRIRKLSELLYLPHKDFIQTKLKVSQPNEY